MLYKANSGSDLYFGSYVTSWNHYKVLHEDNFTTVTDSRYLRSDQSDSTVGNLTATNFILSSDRRLKAKIKSLEPDTIDANWKSFELKSEKGQKRYGVIAQELEKNHPEFIRTDDKGMKSVAYIDLLIAKVAELEARLNKIEQ